MECVKKGNRTVYKSNLYHACSTLLTSLQGRKGWIQLIFKAFPLQAEMSSLEDFSVYISPRRAENPFLGRIGLLWTSTMCYWVAEQSSSQKMSVLSLFIEEVIQSLKDRISCFHSQEIKTHSYLSTRVNPWDNSENLAIQLARKTLPNFCARSYKTLI